MSTTTPRIWTVSATSTLADPLEYHCGEHCLTGPGALTLERISPVEAMLLSVAGCFALSCRPVFARLDVPRTGYRVVVHGTKAAGTPARIAQIDIVVDFAPGLSASDADQIVTQAKKLCTVTNTLSDAPAISVRCSH